MLVDRQGDELHIELNRPQRYNAITRQLREELCDALTLAVLDDSLRAVTMSGLGPSFCSGGDVAEFGARADIADAHTSGLAQSPARLVHRLRSG